MMEIFKTDETQHKLVKTDQIEKGCWINLCNPSEDEIALLEKALNVSPGFLRDPLDEEEKPRIDVDDGQTLIIVDMPYVYKEEGELKFETMPLGLLVLEEAFITICLRDSFVANHFRRGDIKDFFTFKKTRFVLQILFLIAKEFLKYLRYIDKKTEDVEDALKKSMRNREIFKLLTLQKSLVYFTTSLKSNELMMEKLLRGKFLKMYEEDQDLLEDVIIENKQAIDMANIYSSILSNTLDAYASVISNNLNIVMKFLTSVTIIMAIPTMIASFYGMNVALPLGNNPMAFGYVLGFSALVSALVAFILNKKEML